MDHCTIINFWEKSRILPPDWSADFANEDRWEKSRLTKESKDLALLISNSNLDNMRCRLKFTWQWKVKSSLKVEYCMSKLVNMELGQRIKPPRLDLNAKPWDFLDVDERPPPHVKLVDARHHTQLLVAFIVYGQRIRLYSCGHNEIVGYIKETQ